MKRKISSLLICLPIALMILSSCQKQVDKPDSPSESTTDEVAGTPLPGQTTYCRIESLWLDPFTPGQRFHLILYDQYENPVAITQPNVGTGHPYHTFKYDHWHRLREYRGEYSNGNFEFWRFYGFDLNGRIGVDTQYVLGAMGPTGPLSYFERTIHKYTYDGQGRIIKVVSDAQINPTHTEVNYTYDASGNLVYPPASGITYDNKMNMNRTNDIWQFLNRDYSMNNPFTADAYNGTGFPTVLNLSRNIAWLNEFQIRNSQISYSCRPANF